MTDTTERQHTLVPCATCGVSGRPRDMVSAGDDWLCLWCAGKEIGRLRGRQDWTGDEVEDAVNRIRRASEVPDLVIAVSTDDLRKLFVSADGVADSYSILLEHTTGLTKPTTDPHIACTLADDRESERFREYLKDELAALGKEQP